MYESGEEWSFAKLLIYLCINMTESYTYNPKSLRILWVEQWETKTRLFFEIFLIISGMYEFLPLTREINIDVFCISQCPAPVNSHWKYKNMGL